MDTPWLFLVIVILSFAAWIVEEHLAKKKKKD